MYATYDLYNIHKNTCYLNINLKTKNQTMKFFFILNVNEKKMSNFKNKENFLTKAISRLNRVESMIIHDDTKPKGSIKYFL